MTRSGGGLFVFAPDGNRKDGEPPKHKRRQEVSRAAFARASAAGAGIEFAAFILN
jgi:hypothetical protein